MENDYAWTPILVVGVLILASIGNILMGLLAYSAYVDEVPGGGKMLLGSIFLGIQCILFDGIYWNLKFPW